MLQFTNFAVSISVQPKLVLLSKMQLNFEMRNTRLEQIYAIDTVCVQLYYWKLIADCAIHVSYNVCQYWYVRYVYCFTAKYKTKLRGYCTYSRISIFCVLHQNYQQIFGKQRNSEIAKNKSRPCTSIWVLFWTINEKPLGPWEFQCHLSLEQFAVRCTFFLDDIILR